MMEILNGENMIKCRERGGVDLGMTCGVWWKGDADTFRSHWAMCGLLHDQIDIVNGCVSPSRKFSLPLLLRSILMTGFHT